MGFEKYIPVYDGGDEGVNLRPMGKAFVAKFDFDVKENKNYRLFTTGESEMFYQWKNEPHYPANYQDISDAFDSIHAEKSRFCVDLSSRKPEKFVRRIYKKLMCDPVILAYRPLVNPSIEWDFGIFVKGEDVKVEKDGYLRMRVDVRYKKEGVSPLETVLAPDETHIIDFPRGTFDSTRLSKTITPPNDKISSMGIWIEGINYSGKVYIERPFVMNAGYQLIPDFTSPVPNKENFNWTGQNISRREWPEFRVKLNGETIFEGEVFERCHRHSEWALDLPKDLLKDKNTLSYELISDYHDPLPYNIYSVGITEQKGGVFSVISTSYAGVAGGSAYVLVRTGVDNAKIDVTYENENISGKDSYSFEKCGLHGIKLSCKSPCANAKFTLTCNGIKKDCVIPVIVERKEDNVLLGTGDMVYINQNLADTEEYLCWYLSEYVGNFLTIRPTYRWCGTRVINPEVWELVSRVLNELDIKYVIMADGRELPGLNCNPSDDMLEGENYLGRQEHERDGKAYYWGIRDGSLTDTQKQYNDMLTQMRKEYPENCQLPPTDCAYFGNEVYPAVHPYYSRDVKEVSKQTIERFKTWKKTNRHTGPSNMYKYILEAGFEWLGAETMYSNIEIQLAFLRGLAKCVDMKSFGVHHALQWSSAPHDDPAKYSRFRLALYLAYMLGATDINTEEGLWRLEEFFSKFHRFSEPCIEYTKQHQDLFKYILTHSREGKFHTPLAVLHGRLDGATGFIKGCTWGCYDMDSMDSEESWDILKVFYPSAKVSEYFLLMPCPDNEPLGFYSGTPQGNIDIIPIEYGKDVYKDYRAMAFMGYNLAEDSDLKTLESYVKNGGKLLLTRAHLTDTTNLYDIKDGNLTFGETPLCFTKGKPEFCDSSVNGVSLKVCTNAITPDKVLQQTDDGLPLVCEYNLGKGTVIMFNTSAYPAHKAICKLYEKELKDLMDYAVGAEKIWVKADEKVEFTVYDTETNRHIYLLAVDWYNDPNKMRNAKLISNGFEYNVEIPFGVMLKCVSNGEKTVWCNTENGDVLSVSNDEIKVQGTDTAEFTIAENGTLKNITIDFTKETVQVIK